MSVYGLTFDLHVAHFFVYKNIRYTRKAEWIHNTDRLQTNCLSKNNQPIKKTRDTKTITKYMIRMEMAITERKCLLTTELRTT